jgi:hypothetical protein
MSAWVCSDRHINALATFLAAREIGFPWQGGTFSCIDQPANVANVLFAENVKSVNYRYDEADPTVGHEFELVVPLPELGNLYRQFQCYDYQACEHPSYEHSLAKAMVTAGMSAIEVQLSMTKEQIERSVEYNNAPWGLD